MVASLPMLLVSGIVIRLNSTAFSKDELHGVSIIPPRCDSYLGRLLQRNTHTDWTARGSDQMSDNFKYHRNESHGILHSFLIARVRILGEMFNTIITPKEEFDVTWHHFGDPCQTSNCVQQNCNAVHGNWNIPPKKSAI